MDSLPNRFEIKLNIENSQFLVEGYSYWRSFLSTVDSPQTTADCNCRAKSESYYNRQWTVERYPLTESKKTTKFYSVASGEIVSLYTEVDSNLF